MLVNVSEDTGFWTYVFPLVSISLAGIYDAYGRYEKDSPKNFKLGLRVFFDVSAMVLAAYFANAERIWTHYIPSIILLLNGILLLYEAIRRVKTAIEISPWYVKLK